MDKETILRQISKSDGIPFCGETYTFHKTSHKTKRRTYLAEVRNSQDQVIGYVFENGNSGISAYPERFFEQGIPVICRNIEDVLREVTMINSSAGFTQN